MQNVAFKQDHRVLGIVDVSTGGCTSTIVDSKVIFVAALKANAHAIVLCHSHPSGEVKPSYEDIALTERIRTGAKLLNMKLLDHLVISAEGFYSMADSGEV